MVHNPAHDLFSIGHFLCRVRVVDCCDLSNGAERQWFIVATISGNFFLRKSLLAGTTTVMHIYGPNDTYPCVFNMKRTSYPYLLADFFDAPQFEMINFANVNIEHYNSDPVISLFGNMQIMFQYIEFLKLAWRHSVYYYYDKARNTPYFASWHLGDSLGVYRWFQCRYKWRFYKSHSRLSKITTGNRCRNIRIMQNVTNRNLIDPNKSGTWG